MSARLVAVIGSNANQTNGMLVSAWCGFGIDAALLAPSEARRRLQPGDVAVARLDVLPTLDGVEPGLLVVIWLERSGVRVFNSAAALLAAHDKLLTARVLARAGLPHPRTVHLPPSGAAPRLEPPIVVKPRYGSWGRDVFRCRTAEELDRCLEAVRDRPWFRRHGALLQELLPPPTHDLRILVVRSRVVGAIERVPAPGEWRTNISLGGSLRPTEPPPEACELGLQAVRAIGADFVGVDLLPDGSGGYTVLELNGAVEFRPEYSLPGKDVYAEIASALDLAEAPARLPATVPA